MGGSFWSLALLGCGAAAAPFDTPEEEVLGAADATLEGVGATTDAELQQALTRARDQWDEAGADAYTLKANRRCFCARRPFDDVFVRIEAGVVVEALGNDGSGSYSVAIEPDGHRDWYTVPGMFDRIEERLSTTDRMEVVFDDLRGFPMVSVFDYTLASADEGESFEMWDLVEDAAGLDGLDWDDVLSH
jgi:hypothetical protein